MEFRSRKSAIHHWILIGLMVLVAVGMQTSHFLVSIGVILMSANYLLEGDYLNKWNTVKKNPVIWLFAGFFILHVFGMLWTEDMDYGWADIQRKLPLLAIPIVFGSSRTLSKNQFEWVLLFFLLVSTLSSFIGLYHQFENDVFTYDYRKASPYLSHIRLSLMIGTSVFATGYLALTSIQWRKARWAFVLWGIWLGVFLILLRSSSGIVAFGVAAMVLGWKFSDQFSKTWMWATRFSMLLFVFMTIGYVIVQVQSFYEIEDQVPASEVVTTKYGEEYVFKYHVPAIENGHYVFAYLAPKELEETWNKRSELDYNGVDKKGQELKLVVWRYLTSKGLRKDRESLEALSDDEIAAIEHGIANVRMLERKSLNNILYQYIWEVHNFRSGLNPQGNSVGQRFLFWQVGMSIFKDNWFKGVGTGDVQLSFDKKYEELPVNIDKKYQLRAHNQYLTVAITFGFFGLVYFIVMFCSGWYGLPNSNSYLFLGVFAIVMVSMLDEDTLETQFGITYALFFYFLFLFHPGSGQEKIAD